ncbi:MAG: hypothetical protein EB059_07980 [Alphaproteobacteria bacterium]|nr:hypothetical protein [Alphaproteobacteria bacterium]
MEILDRELPVVVFPVHVRRAAVVAIVDCPKRSQFIGPRFLKQAAPQSIWLFRSPEITDGRIGGRTPQIDAQRLGQHAVVADGKTLA